jgi:hypothetical protein
LDLRAGKGVERRLAAILIADVVGYSSLMERDEAGTLGALKADREQIVDPAITAHGGRIVKSMGDGLLVEFTSAVAAVRCAMEIQSAGARQTATADVSAQLIDAKTAHHLWAERYDRDLADVFAVVDEITQQIAVAIVPELEIAERKRASTKPPGSLDAWDCWQRGMVHKKRADPGGILPCQGDVRACHCARSDLRAAAHLACMAASR